MTEPKPIFLSFSGADRETARQVRNGLLAEGVRVWWDEDIEAGEDWVEQLQQKLDCCSAYLILYGQAGHTRWVRAELHYALRRHFEQDLPILPFRLPGTAPEALPPFLSIFQAPELVEPFDCRWLAHQLSHQHQPSPEKAAYDPAVCPFPGLRAYQQEEARFFFGRQTETTEALQRLGRGTDDYKYRRWLLVEGPSGVGKSSLVRAGLLPAIEKGWLFTEGRFSKWFIAQMRPGVDPLENLAAALYRLQPDNMPDIGVLLERLTRKGEAGENALRHLLKERIPAGAGIVLLVDQLEEIFTLTQDPQQRARLDALLDRAIGDADGPLYLVTTIRSDFMLQFSDLPRLNRRLNEDIGRYTLQPIARAGLTDIVETPARLAGLSWSEPSLPQRIVDDAVKAGRAALPLLGNLLWLLWKRRQAGGVLSAPVFDQELQGVGGALAQSADSLVEKICRQDPKQGEERVRQLFLALINDGRGGQDTRRTLPLSAAIQVVGGPSQRWLLDQLSGQPAPDDPPGTANPRLILVGEGETEGVASAAEHQVEIAHEALLASDAEDNAYWPRLAKWLKANRIQLEKRDLLESLARDWETKGRPRFDGLLTGKQIREFREVHGAREPAPTYLQVSRRGLRLWRSGIAVLAIGFALMVNFVAGVLNSGLFESHPNPGSGLFFEHLHARWMGPGPIPPKLVRIEPGTFLMGSPEGVGDDDERPQHQVTIDAPYWLGAYEVTFDEYDRYAMATGAALPSDAGWGRGKRPVIYVSWHDARAYADWLSQQTGTNCRLPSEAEWEYAVRAGTDTNYWWGDGIGENRANCDGCGSQWDKRQTAPVDAFDESDRTLHQSLLKEDLKADWLLHGVHGNVFEWVEDCALRYAAEPSSGSPKACPEGVNARVLRGGSWINNPDNARASNRNRNNPDNRNNNIGFRLLCSAHIPQPFGCRHAPLTTVGGVRRRQAEWRGCVPPAWFLLSGA